MNKVLKTDAEAWNFLIEMGGEFRIHTNKNGLRVYICVYDRTYGGYFKTFERRYDLSKPINKKSLNGRPAFIHREARKEIPAQYNETETGKTLVEAVNKHLSKMPGDTEFTTQTDWHVYYTNFEKQLNDDKSHCCWTLEFKGTLEEFKKLSLKPN